MTTRCLGIDYGDRRIGLALSDPMRIIASALSVIDQRESQNACKEINALCVKHEVGTIVVGLPLNMDGSRGPRVEKTDAFITKLQAEVDLPIVTWDERLSSKSAEATLIEAGMRREKRKGIIDKVAAQVILQHYLDSQPE